MRRFELVEGASSKFWQIELQGNMFTVVYGRIGTAGQRQEKTFDDDDKALKEHDKLVAEKTKKGYAETGDARAAAAPATTATTATTAPAAKAAAPKVTATKKAVKADDDDDAETAPTAAATTPAPPAAPKPAPTALDENAIFWTDALKKRVLPRAGGVVVKSSPLPSQAKSLAEVQKAMAARKEALCTILPRHDGHEALKRVEAAVATGSALSSDDASVLIAWCSAQPDYRVPIVFDEVIEWLVATIALPATTAAVLMGLERSVVNVSSTTKLGETVPMQLHEVAGTGWNVGFAEGATMRGLDRLRERLQQANPEARTQSIAVASALRTTDSQCVATSFLFPEQTDWVRDDIALIDKHKGYRCLLASISDPSMLPVGITFTVDEFVPHRYHRQDGGDLAATLLDTCGLAAAPLFAAASPAPYENGEMNKLWYAALAAVGDDRTIAVLVDKLSEKEAQAALSEATLTQPRRVLRLVASAAAVRGKAGEPARAVLGALVRRSPEIVAELLPHLPADGAKAVNAIIAEAGDVVADAADADIPAFLRAPPWHSKKAKAAGPIKLGLTIKALAPTTSWAKNERDKWQQQKGWGETERTIAQWQKLAETTQDLVDTSDLATMPTEFVETFAARAQLSRWSDDGWYPRIVARHEHAALAFYGKRLEEDLAKFLPNLVPLGRAEFALPMATALATKKSLRDTAKAWLLRHPKHAAAGLLPTALGKMCKDREYAEGALRFVANNGQDAEVAEVATDNGVQAELQQILSSSAFDTFPARLPKLPTWADASALPRPVLKDKMGALSLSATAAVVEMLAFSGVDDPYAGIDAVKEACEPKSLARFSWALFQAWLTSGASSKEAFGMTSLGFYGDDDAARKLAAYAREWPGESANARAVSALDVIGAIGTDVALMHLNAIALKSKFKALQTKAQGKIEVIAEARGFTREELEDRLAPDLGLDDDGSLKLDFGARVFTVGFDEALRPFVKDSDGARLKDLPKPKQSDDDEKSKAAVEQWGQLKKDAKQAASLQILRLELAMCGRRRFVASDFVELFVRHPLVVHIVRRLVWATYGADGKIAATFRVAEDRSFADASDDAFDLHDDASVSIPHPLELSAAVSAQWSQVFGDYELVQPFAQLGRPTATPDAAQKASNALDTVKGVLAKTGKVLGLETRRWRRGPPQDGGVVGWMEKHLADGRHITLNLDPGLYTGMLSESPEQTLGSASLGGGPSWASKGDAFGTLDAIAYSELVRDLESLKS